MDNNEKQIKYVDLVGLEHFATRLKSYLKNHVMEYGIFQELLNEIQNRTFYKVVTSYEELLNESPKKNIIYLVPDNLGNFLEYIWIEDRKEYEQLGSFTPELKLDDYLKKEDSPFEKGEAENSAVLKGGNNQVTNANEVAIGKYNKSNSDTCFSVGMGISDTDRKNAFEVKQNGEIYITGIGGFTGDNYNSSKSVQEVINELINKLNEITTND